MVIRHKSFLRNFDEILYNTLMDEMKHSGINFLTESNVTEVNSIPPKYLLPRLRSNYKKMERKQLLLIKVIK